MSALQPASPRDAAPSPRRGPGYSPGFDGVLGGNDAWVARRRSEVSPKTSSSISREGGGDQPESRPSDIRENLEPNENERPGGDSHDLDHTTASKGASHDPPPVDGQNSPVEIAHLSLNVNGASNPGPLNEFVSASPATTVDLAAVEWSYKDPSGQIQGIPVTLLIHVQVLQIAFYRTFQC